MKEITTREQAWEQYRNQQQPEKKGKAKYCFKSPEFENVLKTLITPEPLNPQTEIVRFNKITSDRGYSFWDKQSIDNWNECYSLFTNDDIQRMAEVDLRLLLASVKNIGDKDHDRNRLLFLNQFGSSEAKAKEFFIQQNNSAFGRDCRPFQDTSYENRFLNFGQITTNHQSFELETFKKLIASKWQCCGYIKDSEFKQKYVNDYCIALTTK